MPTWTSNLGDSTNPSNIGIDSLDDLSDGTAEDNKWTAARVNALKNAVLELERVVLGNASAKNILSLTSKINADQLDGYHGSSYYKTTDSINATTFGGQAPSYYWYGSTTTKSYDAEWIIPSASGADLSTYGYGAYKITWTFASAFSRICVPAQIAVYIGATGGTPGLQTGGEGGGGSYTITPSESGATNNRAPYYVSSGVLITYAYTANTSAFALIIRNMDTTNRYRIRIQANCFGL